MSSSITSSGLAHLETVIALARVLERVERSPEPVDAGQYQLLVMRL